MESLTASQFREWVAANQDFQLIDVRQPAEHHQFNIGGLLIPLNELMQNKSLIDRQRPVVFYCEKGIRSVIAIQRLEAAGFSNLYNLSGGMAGWRALL
jgi:rhodanese-related sulfurtransferase